jgi:exonuclease VII small subunit
MSKKEKDFNLSKALQDLKKLVSWFEDQDQVDVEKGLKKVKEGAELVKESKKRLKEIENEFEEVKKDIESS